MKLIVGLTPAGDGVQVETVSDQQATCLRLTFAEAMNLGTLLVKTVTDHMTAVWTGTVRGLA